MRQRLLVAVAAAALIAGCTTNGGDRPAADHDRSSISDPDRAVEEHEGRVGDDEVAEEAELTHERLEAFEAAKTSGVVGSGLQIVNNPAAGWNGEQLLNPSTDDWEPALAADPKAPFVYLLT